MQYAIHNSKGEILRVVDVPESEIEAQLVDGEAHVQGECTPYDSVDVATKTIIKGNPPAPRMVRAKPAYVEKRKKLYPSVESQLDMLWHGMDKGVLTKVEPFYSRLKFVKDTVPKTVGNEVDTKTNTEVL